MPVTVGTLPSIVASAATAKAPVKVQADKAARQFLSICDLFEGNLAGFRWIEAPLPSKFLIL